MGCDPRLTEIEILRKLDHPNVIKYIETIEDYDTYYIVMELCNGGELFDRIIDTEHKLSLVRIARITTQILRAVQHCHENGIVNRDIKSENVLFKTKDPESQIKVIDFGLSAIYSDHDNLHARVGTVFYMSPEVRSLSVEFENIFLFYSIIFQHALRCQRNNPTHSRIL